MLKSNISDIYTHKYTKINFHLDGLPLEKSLNLQSIVILIKSVINKNHNYNYETFLKECFYK